MLNWQKKSKRKLVLYTMANDAMHAQFKRFLEFRQNFMPNTTLRVIPFDDEMNAVCDEMKKYRRVKLIKPIPVLDALGKAIYTGEEYRPGVPSWRYYRKFNCLIGHQNPFIFVDANAVVLSDLAQFVDKEQLSPRAIFFRTRSEKGRTLRASTTGQPFAAIHPTIRFGFNCSMFASQGGFLKTEVIESLMNPGLRKIFGTAPEQGFLSFYIAITGLKADLLSSQFPAFPERHFTFQQALYSKGNHVFFDEAHTKRVLAYKQHGGDLEPLPAAIENVRSSFKMQ